MFFAFKCTVHISITQGANHCSEEDPAVSAGGGQIFNTEKISAPTILWGCWLTESIFGLVITEILVSYALLEKLKWLVHTIPDVLVHKLDQITLDKSKSIQPVQKKKIVSHLRWDLITVSILKDEPLQFLLQHCCSLIQNVNNWASRASLLLSSL